MIPGDHPACSQFALTLDWEHSDTSIKELVDGPPRHARKLSIEERRHKLTVLWDEEQHGRMEWEESRRRLENEDPNLISEYEKMLKMDSSLLRQWEREGTLTMAQKALLERIIIAKTRYSNALDIILYRYLQAEIDASNETYDEPEESYPDDWDDEDYDDQIELPPPITFGPRDEKRQRLDTMRDNTTSITKAQAAVRGYMVRKQQYNLNPSKDIFADETWKWLKGTVLEKDPLEIIQAFQRRFEGTVVRVQAVTRGFLVRKRHAEYRCWLEGTLMEGAPWNVIQEFEDTVYDRLLEETLRKIDNDDFDDEDYDEEKELEELPLRVLAHMRAMLLAMEGDMMKDKQKVNQKTRHQDPVSFLETLFLESTTADPATQETLYARASLFKDIPKPGTQPAGLQALVRFQALARGFIARSSFRRRSGVRFSICDQWVIDRWRSSFGTLSFRVVRRPNEMNGKQWRRQQEMQQRLHGTVITPTKWQQTRKVDFTWTQTVYYAGGYCQIGYRVAPTLTGKEWRIKHFNTQRQWKDLEEDEKVILDCQAARRRLEQKEQRRLEQQQYQQRLQQVLQEGHQKLASHRALYKEALQHQAEEVRRQIGAISARKDLRKKKPRRSNSQHLIDQPHPSLAKIHAPATNVISKVTSTNGQHQSSTASLHRKVVRKKLPQLSTIAGPKSLNPAQQTPIHRKALRTQPFFPQTTTIAGQQSLNPAQQTPIHRKALRQQPFGATGRRGISWHQAWISPTHRKTLRQQPF